MKKLLNNIAITSSNKYKKATAKDYNIKIIDKFELYKEYINTLENKIQALQDEKISIEKNLQQEFNEQINQMNTEFKNTLDQNIEIAYKDGIKKGIEQGKEEKEQELRELFTNVRNILNELNSKREEILSASSEDILKLAISIARKIMKVEPHINNNVVKHVIMSALKKIIDKSKIILHLNPKSIKIIENSMDDILMNFKDLPKVTIVEDKLIGPGDCIIETNSGFIDARLETQLQKIADKLFLDIKRKN